MELFRIYYPTSVRLPILASLPHSGTYIPEGISCNIARPVLQSLFNTDWHLTRLYDFLPSLGVTVIEATHSRYVIDLNRDPDGPLLGPFFSSLVAEKTAFKLPVHHKIPSQEELRMRIARYHHPYHQKIESMLTNFKDVSKRVYLIDLHSFNGPINDDICLGNANGNSCSTILLDRFARYLGNEGFKVAINRVFTGGYITKRYGQCSNTETFQIEIHYSQYLEKFDMRKNERPIKTSSKEFRCTKEKLKRAISGLIADILN